MQMHQSQTKITIAELVLCWHEATYIGLREKGTFVVRGKTLSKVQVLASITGAGRADDHIPTTCSLQ
jgi:hypothetical protein